MPTVYNISNLKILFSYFSFGIIGISGILINIIILNFYDIKILGFFNFFYSLLIILSQLTVGGIQYSVLKHTSILKDNSKELSCLVTSGLFLSTVYFFLFFGIFIFFKDLIYDFFKFSVELLNIEIVLFALFLFSLNKIILMTINGLNLIYHLSIFNTLRSIILLISIILFVNFKFNPFLITYCFFFTELILFSTTFVWFVNKIGFYLPNTYWIKKNFKFGLQAMIGGALLEINTKLDILIIGILLGYKSVGIYSFASAIAEGYSHLYTILKNNIDPILSNDANKKNKKNIFKNIHNIQKNYVVLIIFAGFLILSLYKPIFLDVFNLDKNLINESWFVLLIIMIFMIFVSFFRPFIGLLIALNKPFYFSLIISFGVFLNIFLNLMLIPIFGNNGAAFSTGIVFTFETILLYFVGMKFLKK
jgi:stage V sporulation protein B